MTPPPNPERVVFDALRPFMFPAQATHEAHVAVTALRAAGLLKAPPACGCGPQATSEPQRSDNRDAERAICGAPKPLSRAEWAALDELEGDLKNLTEAERLAQGSDETEGAE